MHPQYGGYLLGKDALHQFDDVVVSFAAKLDRTPVEHDVRHCSSPRAGERDDPVLPGSKQVLRRWYISHLELDTVNLLWKPFLETFDGAEYKVVENVGARRRGWGAGRCKRTTHAALVTITSAVREFPATTSTVAHVGETSGDTGGQCGANPADDHNGQVPSRSVSPMRRCSRTACNRAAVQTLTYVYADSTAVLGPLATYAEPHCYDLCEVHGERLTAPRGWEIVRLAPDLDALGPSSDDLEALANAVREAARPNEAVEQSRQEVPSPETGRRGHLRVLPPLEETVEA